jgi:4a-hydroxytetrahydrobiopterin dehydratase
MSASPSPPPPPPARLSEAEVAAALTGLDAGWHRVGDRLVRELVFSDFAAAFGFLASAAVIAERLGHHPDWLNSYNRVRIELTTHDAGGLTGRDLELARALDAVAARAR